MKPKSNPTNKNPKAAFGGKMGSFESKARQIAKKEGIPVKRGRAILASAGRNASNKAKRANPNLMKISGNKMRAKGGKTGKSAPAKRSANRRTSVPPPMKPKSNAGTMSVKKGSSVKPPMNVSPTMQSKSRAGMPSTMPMFNAMKFGGKTKRY